jgi:hypothetical protein
MNELKNRFDSELGITTLNVLYVGDGDSHLYPVRGEAIIRQIAQFYERTTPIDYITTSSKSFAKKTLADLGDINTIFIDNVKDYRSLKALISIVNSLNDIVHPGWQDEAKALPETEVEAFMKELAKARSTKFRIIYAIDEFVWDAPAGRMCDLQTVQIVESFIEIADSVLVPTADLADAVKYFKFVDEEKEIHVIPSMLTKEIAQVYRDFTRKWNLSSTSAQRTPRVLIKGLELPANVQEFIQNHFKKFDITICSVGEIDDHTAGLINARKVGHIMHWANPSVNKANIGTTYAMERDVGYDFVILCKPDAMEGKMYEICSGDDDIIFSASYGAVVVCGWDHLELGADHISKKSGMHFGKDTDAVQIKNMLESMVNFYDKWNAAYNEVRRYLESRILDTSSFAQSAYYNLIAGPEWTAYVESKTNTAPESVQETAAAEPIADEDMPENAIRLPFGKEG